MPTFQCTAACKFCGTLSNPHVKTRLSPSQIAKIIDDAASQKYELVCFTGGEPTLVGQGLEAAIHRASNHGMATRVVTNAHWATNRETAHNFLIPLVDSGLDEINFSTGDQHARFVPIESVLLAAQAALAFKLPVSIMVELIGDRTVTEETLKTHTIYREIGDEFPNVSLNIHESPWMPLSPKTVNVYPEDVAINEENVSGCKGCDSILTTTTIQANGQIGACCGLGMRVIPELQLGHIDDVSLKEAEQVARNDFLKRWIRIEGPEKILAWATTHDDSIEWSGQYAHRCQACMRIYKGRKVRRVVKEHHREKMADVLFAEWLRHRFDADNDTADLSDTL